MKKIFILSMVGLLFSIAAYAARPASATFTARRGQLIQVSVNGRVINPVASSFVRVTGLPAGNHRVDFRIFNRWGNSIQGQSMMPLQGGVESSFLITRSGRRFTFAQIGAIPLAPPPVAVVPRRAPAPRAVPPRSNQARQGSSQAPAPQNDACSNVMRETEVEAFKNSISGKNFDNTRLTIARQALRRNALMARDVKEIAQLFDQEDNRLEFAKMAYRHTCDVENYYLVNDAFMYEGTSDKLDDFMRRADQAARR
jgi:hypothetical protein